jgi:hypothetical protein
MRCYTWGKVARKSKIERTEEKSCISVMRRRGREGALVTDKNPPVK